jgi:hypothetical protein
MGAATLLLVSLNFPPSQMASVHRARHLASHLPEFGWWPVVVAVDERFHKEPSDAALGQLVPSTVEVHRIKALPLGLTTPFGLGDLSIRSMYDVWSKLKQLIVLESPQGVFFTGWPYYQMLLSEPLRRRFGLPVVLDFQDPWVSNQGATFPTLSKQGLSHRVALFFEPRAIRNADFVTSVSDTQNEQMAIRYPWFDESRMAAIPIGCDPKDFEHLRTSGTVPPEGSLGSGLINFSFVGTFMPRSGALVRVLMRSLRRLLTEKPQLVARIRLNFVCTSNQPADDGSYRVRPIAEDEGVAHLVHEIPRRVPYLEALATLACSEALLLIGSDEPHYTASKIYPALMSGRPYLSLFHQASSSHAILSAAGGGISLAFSNADELSSLEVPLAQALRTLAVAPQTFGCVDPAVYAPFHATAIAEQFARIFDRVSGRS